MTKYQITVNFTARSTVTATVEVPDGLTKSQLQDLLERESDKVGDPAFWDDIEIEDSNWVGEAPVAIPPVLTIT